MLAFIRRHAETIAVAFATATVTAAAPAIASGVGNADKVDGFDAVACAAGANARSGKLVAACDNGYLPNGLIQKAPNADRLDGVSASGFYRSGSTVVNAAHLGGLQASDLTRVGYVVSPSSTTRVGKNGKVVATSIMVPTDGFVVMHASSDNYNPKVRDMLACAITFDGGEVPGSRRWFVVNSTRSDDDCATDAVVPVTKLGAHPIELHAIGVDSPRTAFGRTVLWAFFVPFDATGGRPQP